MQGVKAWEFACFQLKRVLGFGVVGFGSFWRDTESLVRPLRVARRGAKKQQCMCRPDHLPKRWDILPLVTIVTVALDHDGTKFCLCCNAPWLHPIPPNPTMLGHAIQMLSSEVAQFARGSGNSCLTTSLKEAGLCLSLDIIRDQRAISPLPSQPKTCTPPEHAAALSQVPSAASCRLACLPAWSAYYAQTTYSYVVRKHVSRHACMDRR